MNNIRTSSIQKEILTTSDVMELLDISRTTLYQRMRAGILVGHKLGGRIYFYRSAIKEALEKGKITMS